MLEAKLIKIGNSRGIRLPKKIISKYGLGNLVLLEETEDGILIVACPLTTSLHPTWRSRIQIVCAGQQSEIAVDQIRTISKQRLIKKMDKLSPEDSGLLRQLITEMYGE